MYLIFEGDDLVASHPDKAEAISIAREMSEFESDGVFKVACEGRAIASFTQHRITGKFVKQRWRGDVAETVGEVEFDATDHILSLPYENMLTINKDADYATDDVGRDHIQWDGPFEVYIVESICKFFGVDGIGDISEQQFEFVKNEMNPSGLEEKNVRLVVMLDIKAAKGVDLNAALDEMDISFSSRTPGFRILNAAVSERSISPGDPD